MKFTNKEALLFDLDGTLIDSVPDLALSLNLMLKELGKQAYPVDVIRSWVGNGALKITERGLSGSINVSPDLDPAEVEKALDMFLDFYDKNVCVDTTLYPNVKSTLESLKEAGYKLAIVTNKPEQFVLPILEKFGMADLFELIIGGDTLPKRKPDPMQLEFACEKLAVKAENCIMIGDSKNDIYAAKAANMQSVGLTYGYNHGENIQSHGADLVCDDFAELLSVLNAETAIA